MNISVLKHASNSLIFAAKQDKQVTHFKPLKQTFWCVCPSSTALCHFDGEGEALGAQLTAHTQTHSQSPRHHTPFDSVYQ